MIDIADAQDPAVPAPDRIPIAKSAAILAIAEEAQLHLIIAPKEEALVLAETLETKGLLLNTIETKEELLMIKKTEMKGKDLCRKTMKRKKTGIIMRKRTIRLLKKMKLEDPDIPRVALKGLMDLRKTSKYF